MRYLNTHFPAFLIITVMIVSVSCNQKSEKKEEETSNGMQEKITQQQEYIEIDVPSISSLKEGDTLGITNSYRDKSYNLVIRKVQKNKPDLVSISANIEDRDTGLAALILRDGERLSGSLEFYKEDLRFRIAYDTTEMQHYLVIESLEDLDIQEGSKPLVPPINQE